MIVVTTRMFYEEVIRLKMAFFYKNDGREKKHNRRINNQFISTKT